MIAMAIEMRRTGIDVVGDRPWGTHFCHFYETKEDLLDTLVSYFKAGLESRECCLWVVSEPLTEKEARHALKQAVPDLDRYLADRSIEMVLASDWYLQGGTFDLKRVAGGWNAKLARALARGYAGVRVTGNTAWLEKKDWKDFCEYEEALNALITNQRLTVLCTYPLAASGAAEILDVARTHQFAIAKRHGHWEVVEIAGFKQAKEEIKQLNEELELRVVERTSQLTAVNDELRKEITARKRAEEALREQASLLNLTHDTVFVRDMNDVITYWNRGAEELYGWTREEAVGQVSHQLMQTIFPAPLEEINAELLRTGRWEGELTHTKRDGTQVVVASRWSLQRDEQGQPVAILETNNDITERKRAEEALHKAQAELAHVTRVATLGEMTASIAHEVNQPLAAVVTNGQCLPALARPRVARPGRRPGRPSERIIRDGHRASEVIGRIRALARKPSAERLARHQRNHSRGDRPGAQRSAQQSGVAQTRNSLPTLPLVRGDRIQLQQVI